MATYGFCQGCRSRQKLRSDLVVPHRHLDEGCPGGGHKPMPGNVTDLRAKAELTEREATVLNLWDRNKITIKELRKLLKPVPDAPKADW